MAAAELADPFPPPPPPPVGSKGPKSNGKDCGKTDSQFFAFFDLSSALPEEVSWLRDGVAAAERGAIGVGCEDIGTCNQNKLVFISKA